MEHRLSQTAENPTYLTSSLLMRPNGYLWKPVFSVIEFSYLRLTAWVCVLVKDYTFRREILTPVTGRGSCPQYLRAINVRARKQSGPRTNSASISWGLRPSQTSAKQNKIADFHLLVAAIATAFCFDGLLPPRKSSKHKHPYKDISYIWPIDRSPDLSNKRIDCGSLCFYKSIPYSFVA